MDERTQVNLLRVLETFTLHARRRQEGARRQRARARRLQPRPRGDGRRRASSARISTTGSTSSRCTLPPLRERSEDIPVLAERASARVRRASTASRCASIPAETQRLLAGYDWPGNVRELRNVIEQAVLLARGAELDPPLLPQMLHRAPAREEIIRIADRHRDGRHRARGHPAHARGQRRQQDRDRRGARHQPPLASTTSSRSTASTTDDDQTKRLRRAVRAAPRRMTPGLHRMPRRASRAQRPGPLCKNNALPSRARDAGALQRRLDGGAELRRDRPAWRRTARPTRPAISAPRG